MQVFLFKNIGYYNLATPFPYILIIFLLPTGMPNFVLFSIALLTGLAVDTFYDTLGVNAAACIALAAYRVFFLKITIENDMDSFITPILGEMNFKWFLSYTFFGTLIHHFVLILLETFSFKHFQYTLATIGLSCIFTMAILLIFSFLFYKKKSRI
ncbi:rod shape-determining protein MreD [Sphingobacterium sp. SG20118]|uniref:rod shape-determining protein MreD n=2 Tax=Sphingobacteriaceae TaxID=84566 RepID=UPI0037DFC3A0